MTEQEAEVWAARLTRIWAPQKVVGAVVDEECLFYAQVKRSIYVEVQTSGEVFLHFHAQDDYDDYIGSLSAFPNGAIHHNEGISDVPDSWLPFFRRCCWLSGLSIEASAHEKVEWIQGFTREEVESWNLKM